MSKKKDFKGVATSLVNPIASLDDFLGAEETDKKAATTTAPAADPEPEPIQQEQESRAGRPKPKLAAAQSTPKKETRPRRRKARKKTPVVQEEPEKIRVSLFLASNTSFELDELKMNIRRITPRHDMAKISKSSIVEAAIDIVKAEFEEYGIDSDIVKGILKY